MIRVPRDSPVDGAPLPAAAIGGGAGVLAIFLGPLGGRRPGLAAARRRRRRRPRSLAGNGDRGRRVGGGRGRRRGGRRRGRRRGRLRRGSLHGLWWWAETECWRKGSQEKEEEVGRGFIEGEAYGGILVRDFYFL